ncbi:hypothetical protein LP414_16405 [Polaromonas sp. P1(28)-13]|nr:hypothetical protein LP414_16405 [Polaromonas sp. P1(28)-13]
MVITKSVRRFQTTTIVMTTLMASLSLGLAAHAQAQSVPVSPTAPVTRNLEAVPADALDSAGITAFEKLRSSAEEKDGITGPEHSQQQRLDVQLQRLVGLELQAWLPRGLGGDGPLLW